MKPDFLRWKFFALCVVVITAGSSCSAPTGSSMLISRLDGRGAVGVSADNPFLAANMLLSNEIEAHEEVKGFFEKKGMPVAVRVEESFWSPTVIYIYYPEANQKYEMERAGESWIFNGPFNLPKVKSDQSSIPTRNVPSTPKGAAPATPSIVSATAPALLPKPLSGTTTTQLAPTPSASPTIPPFRSPQQPAPIAFDDLVKEAQGSPAELSPRGDLVHYVTFPGENLSMIARWYTYDRKNADPIARINRLTNPHRLNVGDTIIIPNYLLKNRGRLTERAVNIFKREVSEPAA